ncbi:MAG: hydroxyacid dehydrogenase [Nitrososphaerota archaeon]|nr:hydroxyacid dehydrogenase [Candidatus Bathyarchaeota archaeon]MDW8048150.1 hydroxyacid dehydrogenase [Nitrososphaerota archaeon]
MEKVKILICDPIDEDGIGIMVREGFHVDFRPSITKEDLSKIIGEYHAVIVRGRTKITRDLINLGGRLRVIGRAGVGLDNIDVEAARERGITVLNTPEATSDSVAELTVGLILAVSRKIALADRLMKEGKWVKSQFEGIQLRGKTLGIIGFGNIGMRVAKICKEFGMKILVTKRTPPQHELLVTLGAEHVSLRDLLTLSDIITVHVPLTHETRNLIGYEAFSLMKNGAILINTSRGGVVNEKALLDALKSGKLAGAGLDVYEKEPPENFELIRLPNVVCTPHIGAQTVEAQRAASVAIADKLVKFFKSK